MRQIATSLIQQAEFTAMAQDALFPGAVIDCKRSGDETSIQYGHVARAIAERGFVVNWDYASISILLVEVGATQQEAAALTAILDAEGWGGKEYRLGDLDFDPRAEMLQWLRDETSDGRR